MPPHLRCAARWLRRHLRSPLVYCCFDGAQELGGWGRALEQERTVFAVDLDVRQIELAGREVTSPRGTLGVDDIYLSHGELAGVRLLDRNEGLVQRLATVLRDLERVVPVSTVGDDEGLVILVLLLLRPLVTQVVERLLVVEVVDVADPLVEEDRKQVRLKVAGIDRATECIRSTP